MAEVFMDVLHTFEISEKIMAITTDNASSNNTLCAAIERATQRETPFSTFATCDHHVPCVAHCLNLMVQAFLGKLGASADESEVEDWEEVDEDTELSPFSDSNNNNSNNSNIGKSMKKLRRMITALRSSPERRTKLQKQCAASIPPIAPLMPIIDMKVRRDSTGDMLQRAFTLKEPMDTVCYQDPKLRRHVLEDSDWDGLKKVQKALDPFRQARGLLTDTRTTTISLILRVFDTLGECIAKLLAAEHEDRNYRAALKAMKTTYKTYRDKVKLNCEISRRVANIIEDIREVSGHRRRSGRSAAKTAWKE